MWLSAERLVYADVKVNPYILVDLTHSEWPSLVTNTVKAAKNLCNKILLLFNGCLRERKCVNTRMCKNVSGKRTVLVNIWFLNPSWPSIEVWLKLWRCIKVSCNAGNELIDVYKQSITDFIFKNYKIPSKVFKYEETQQM